MILHERRKRPDPWPIQRAALRRSWLVPLLRIEWVFEWFAYLLSRWSFLEVLEYLGSFSILIAVIFYFSESGDRVKQRHYQAWQVINTAQGKGGSGGRIEALQELDEDGVPLVGVDVAGAFLQGIRLSKARLIRADLSRVDARNGDFHAADLTGATLHSGNFRNGDLSGAHLENADLGEVDFCSANLSGAVLDGAMLDAADFGNADFGKIKWEKIASLKDANIRRVRNPPDGFVQWALQHGASTADSGSDCR